MTWMGPTYGMWADTVDIINEQTDALNRSNASLAEWKAHAKKCESALQEVNEMYINKTGAEKAQAALKDLALEEIKRLDPSNKLLDAAYRKEVYDKAKDEYIKTISKKK